MKRILQNIIPYKIDVALVIVMLVIQAVGELMLPQYTSDIVDVGIQNQGVEHILPSVITAEDYGILSGYMNDDEKEIFSRYFKQNGSNYARELNSVKELEQMDSELLLPVMMSANAITDRETAKNSLELMGETLVRSGIVKYCIQLMKNAGEDVNKVQKDYLKKKGLMMMLITILTAIDSVLAGLFAARVGAGVGRDLRQKTFESVMKFSASEIDQFSSSSLITRCTNDIQLVSQTTATLLRMIIYAPILGFGGVIMVILSRANMGIYIAVALAVILMTLGIIMGIALPKMRIMQKKVDNLNRVSRELLTGIQVIRTFGREKNEEKRFDAVNSDLRDVVLFTNRTLTFMMPITYFVMYVMEIVIIWVAAKRIDLGQMQIGALMAFITYAVLIVTAFVLTTMWCITLPRAFASADRIAEVIETKCSIVDSDKVADLQASERKGKVEFDHVSFRFPGANEDVLHDINFVMNPGEVTAIIGSTGSGKSALVSLIPRLYDVTAGNIRIDGTDIRQMPQKALRSMIGFVPQKGLLFTGTIEDNIRFGNPDATLEDIKKTARIAQAQEFIEKKPEGYNAMISQGGKNVSGGQKQRLSIARAIAGNHSIYIFDDSFSALDMKTDYILRQALKEITQDSSMLIVAQRISTIMNATQILVLDEGKIVGKGTHDELMKSCEVYRQIARSQMSDEELGKMSKGGAV
ncbi:ABC transporter ATP-binding protein [Butyrivibrio sp. YAB3001]|uniref:ABC transporter ATP-binding protein n=1 Tax=Butyrivibrio sp. YAB3001 TaxID=1520812 RepID=UPI0008F63A30|nr:ABC transporter ATP-binding protein [Butyrivibrio sp. YAB3001]SFC86739.1 ATP-binding cassette, subfamily B [Butyrivibrio sp. YAB3001]